MRIGCSDIKLIKIRPLCKKQDVQVAMLQQFQLVYWMRGDCDCIQ